MGVRENNGRRHDAGVWRRGGLVAGAVVLTLVAMFGIAASVASAAEAEQTAEGAAAAGAAGGVDLSADNVVVVLDASGSMSEKMRGTDVRKMKAAKAALREAVRQIPDHTRVGVLVFSASGGGEEWVYPLAPLDRAKIYEAVSKPEPGGGTPLGEFIKKAADRLLEQRKKQYGYGSYRLLIVTDGEASDPYLVDAYVPDAVAKGLRIDVIGVDMRAQHTLATKVHSYRRADDPEALRKAVAEVFAEVGGAAGADQTGADAFAAIAPLPDQTALALLQALSGPSDAPLGEAEKHETASLLPPAATSQPTPRPASNSPVHSSPATISKPEDKRDYVAYVVGLIVAISVLRKLLRGGRKG